MDIYQLNRKEKELRIIYDNEVSKNETELPYDLWLVNLYVDARKTIDRINTIVKGMSMTIENIEPYNIEKPKSYSEYLGTYNKDKKEEEM